MSTITTTSKQSKKKSAPDQFSDFFLHASQAEKIKVFTEVARKACEDQRKVFEKAKMSFKLS